MELWSVRGPIIHFGDGVVAWNRHTHPSFWSTVREIFILAAPAAAVVGSAPVVNGSVVTQRVETGGCPHTRSYAADVDSCAFPWAEVRGEFREVAGLLHALVADVSLDSADTFLVAPPSSSRGFLVSLPYQHGTGMQPAALVFTAVKPPASSHCPSDPDGDASWRWGAQLGVVAAPRDSGSLTARHRAYAPLRALPRCFAGVPQNAPQGLWLVVPVLAAAAAAEGETLDMLPPLVKAESSKEVIEEQLRERSVALRDCRLRLTHLRQAVCEIEDRIPWVHDVGDLPDNVAALFRAIDTGLATVESQWTRLRLLAETLREAAEAERVAAEQAGAKREAQLTMITVLFLPFSTIGDIFGMNVCVPYQVDVMPDSLVPFGILVAIMFATSILLGVFLYFYLRRLVPPLVLTAPLVVG